MNVDLKAGDIFVYKESKDMWVHGVVFDVTKCIGYNSYNKHSNYNQYNYYIISHGNFWCLGREKLNIDEFNQYSYFADHLTVIGHMDKAELLAKVI